MAVRAKMTDPCAACGVKFIRGISSIRGVWKPKELVAYRGDAWWIHETCWFALVKDKPLTPGPAADHEFWVHIADIIVKTKKARKARLIQ